nr:hypothetical protein Q903MT_gene3157 [Picea sitchensis]
MQLQVVEMQNLVGEIWLSRGVSLGSNSEAMYGPWHRSTHMESCGDPV